MNSPEKQQLVSVIILNWNRASETLATIADLRDQSYPWTEIILVDNASEDGCAEMVEKDFPEVKLVRAEKNLGVPGGRNLGIDHADGEILFFLDNDALLEKNGIDKIVKEFDLDPDVGIISCKILDFYTGKIDYDSWRYSKRQLVQAHQKFETYAFCGGACAMRKIVVDDIGMLQDELFFSREEDEFALRAFMGGYKILYCGDIVVKHKSSSSGRYEGSDRLAYSLRNLLLIIWTYLPVWPAFKMTLYRIIIFGEKGRRVGSWSVVPRGFIDAVRLRKRIDMPRNPMDRKSWKKYSKLDLNFQLHWWEWKKIRHEFRSGHSLDSERK